MQAILAAISSSPAPMPLFMHSLATGASACASTLMPRCCAVAEGWPDPDVVRFESFVRTLNQRYLNPDHNRSRTNPSQAFACLPAWHATESAPSEAIRGPPASH